MEPITFDRTNGRLGDNAGLIERVAAAAMTLGVKATKPIHHRGLAAGCRLLRKVLVERDVVVSLSPDSLFAFPFGDGYWTRLLDRNVTYEPEIDAFLRAISDVDYSFVDCGANFGLWSVLVSSRAYGSHPSLAIEASSSTAARLAKNAWINGGRFRVLHNAVGRVDGSRAWLAGTKHENKTIAGHAEGEGEEVSIVSLNGLLHRGLIEPKRRIVVKLDVEGTEVNALKGGRELLGGDAAVICEDDALDRTHRVSRYLMDKTPWSVFVFDPTVGTFSRVTDLGVLDRLKARSSRGFNVFAATSAFWEQQFLAVGRSKDG